MSQTQIQRFYEILDALISEKNAYYNYFNKKEYAELIQEVKLAKLKQKKQSVDYRRIKRFDILSIGAEEKIIAPIQKENGNIRYYVCYEDIYSILEETHLSTGHGGRTRMLKELNRKYKNVTVESIKTYLKLCEACQKKQKSAKKGIVVQPILHSEMNSRCQVDLIDLQTTPDENNKFVFVYQDHLTKFVILRALKSKRAQEVAYHLLDIFTTFGAPNILHSDNGREFVNNIIQTLCSQWADLKIVHGKPRHSQSQGSVERANQDIENMLSTWMETNNTINWSNGLKFVQAMKNRAYHEGIKCSPYEAMFGCPMRMGIASSAFPQDLIGNLASEEDLENLLGNGKNVVNLKQKTIKTEIKETLSEEKLLDKLLDSDSDLSSFDISTKIESVKIMRKKATLGLEKQAAKMLTNSNNLFPDLKIGENVRIKVPEIDRSKTDPKSLITVIIDIKDGFYQLGNSVGVLKQLYSKNQFTKCSENFIKLEEVKKDKEVSLREVVSKMSLTGGQGFKKCNCLKKCTTKKCACMSSGLLCNSKCHSSLPCANK